MVKGIKMKQVNNLLWVCLVIWILCAFVVVSNVYAYPAYPFNSEQLVRKHASCSALAEMAKLNQEEQLHIKQIDKSYKEFGLEIVSSVSYTRGMIHGMALSLSTKKLYSFNVQFLSKQVYYKNCIIL